MHVLIETIRQWALSVGGPGLFLIALLDSSFLSFPQVADALVLLQSAHHPARMAVYAGAATLGSLCGCLLLFRVGRAGGDVFLLRRFPARHVDRALRFYRRFGILAILLPALLPPPAPLKLFVLLSGAAGMSPLTFAAGIGIGRGVRYFSQGYLASRYGDRAGAWMAQYAPALATGLAVACVAAALVWWMRRDPAPAAEELGAAQSEW
jgi:membrane protein YqaA with SNARE-associated domain